jgi:predicted transcriptional regulator
MKTLKIGILSPEAYKARTLAIARGEYKAKAGEPKLWLKSLESAAKLLSQSNRELLARIAREKPASVTELAQRTGRAKSNLSRTLKTMERYGLVHLHKAKGRTIVPQVNYRDIRFDVRLAG